MNIYKLLTDEKNKNKTLDEIIFPQIMEDFNIDYYEVGALKIYFHCKNESLKREYCKKIMEFCISLQDENFYVDLFFYEKPKVQHGRFFASGGNHYIPSEIKNL